MKRNLLLRILIIVLIIIIGAVGSVLIIRHNNGKSLPDGGEKNVSVNKASSHESDRAAAHKLIIINENGKYGLADTEGNSVGEAEFDMLLTADYGLYYYKEGKNSGFLNADTERVFTTEEIIGTNVSENYVIYTSGGKSGFINICTGKKIDAVYDAVYDFSEGLAAVSVNDKVGFIDTNGDTVIENKYYSKGLYYFTEGLCSVIEGDPAGSYSCYYIDKSGNKVIDEDCDYGMQFYEDRAFVRRGSHWIIIDREGKRVGENEFGPYDKKVPGRFKDGYATVISNGKYGIVNKNGDFEVEPIYDELLEMSEHKVVFKSGDKYGYMKKNGHIIIEPVYDKLTSFKNGVAVTTADNKCGFVTDRGKTVLENEYQKIELLDNGIVKVYKDDTTYFYTNTKGEVVWETK